MKLTGRITDIGFDLKGKPKITITFNEKQSFLDGIDDIKDCEKLAVEMKKYRPRRSLDANAYCWVLLGSLAENQGIPVNELYRHYIKQVGGNSDIVCVKNNALSHLQTAWSRCGLGWVSDTFPSKFEGFTNVILYRGSSEFDSATMARFIDNIIYDCKAVGIDTATPEELSRLKEGWKNDG